MDGTVGATGAGDLAWSGTLPHFSGWQLARPVDSGCVTVTVSDESAQPLSGIAIRAEGLDYQGASGIKFTNAAGIAELAVAVGKTATLYTGSGESSQSQGTVLGASGACATKAVSLSADCVPGAKMDCEVEATGACRVGKQNCEADATWGECQGWVSASDEVCANGSDDDCDGDVDEDCDCASGDTAPCYPGVPETLGVGSCVSGEKTCLGSGQGWSACTGYVLPSVEDCATAVSESCGTESCDCAANAECTNLPASYACACGEGYVGDGDTNCTAYDASPLVTIGNGQVYVGAASANVDKGTTCAIDAAGALKCWGFNVNGSMGIGVVGTLGASTDDVYESPQSVSDGGAEWAMVSGANGIVCAIQKDGALWCWGNNLVPYLSGLSVSTDPVYAAPLQFGNDTWRDISIAYTEPAAATACGIHTDGTLWCWGSNRYGLRGQGVAASTTVYPTPAQVGSDSN